MKSFALLSVSVAALMLTSCDALPRSDHSGASAPGAEIAAPQIEAVPPRAERRDDVIEQLGRTRNDPYSWIKDPDWQTVMQEPEVLQADIRAYLEAENAYTDAALLAPSEALRDTLFEEMKGRVKEDDSSVPMKDGPFAYFVKYREGGQHPLRMRVPVDPETGEITGDEEILLDSDAMAEGLSYFRMAGVAHSPDHSRIAYTVDDQGSEFYTLRIRDLATGTDTDTVIENTYGSFVWADNETIFWIERNENNRPSAIYRRELATGADTLVYEEADPGYFLSLGQSLSGDWIMLGAGDHTTSELRLVPASDPTAEPILVAERQQGLEYDFAQWGDRWVIRTNRDDAKDYKLMTAPIDAPQMENWEELIPHRPGVLLLDMAAKRDHLVRLERADGLPRIVIGNRDGEEHEIAFDEAAYSLGFSSGFEYDTTRLRFSYESPSTPEQTFDYDMASRERVLRKTQEVPSGHDPARYVVERLMAPAHDGETVPVTILRLAETPVDGSAPLYLYGYGSYGATIPASFSTTRLSMVDRGFIYAIAHVRGSMAKGYQWYEDGKLDKKVNTFKDFISAAEALTAQGYGAPGNIVAEGRSAGGLLMGAVSNMAPEMFAGIVAGVPFVDVLNTMSDAELPLTPPEWPEWGNPITDEAAYDTILAYSPYDQVTDRDYPPMFITGGLTDPRVTYWEPTKWVAKLRHEAPNGGPYFLHINMEAGHAGSSGRFDRMKELARDYAFALSAVGHPDASPLPAPSAPAPASVDE